MTAKATRIARAHYSATLEEVVDLNFFTVKQNVAKVISNSFTDIEVVLPRDIKFNEILNLVLYIFFCRCSVWHE